MFATEVSQELLLRERRASGERTIHTDILVYGRPGTVVAKVVNGEVVDRPRFKQDAHLRKYIGAQMGPSGELLTVPPNLYDFVSKSAIDLVVGREAYPLVYGPLYQTRRDPNFTELIDVNTIAGPQANVIFLDHIEGEEVQFGTRAMALAPEMARIITWTAAFEYTQDMVEYDRTWQVQQLNEAFGRAHNILLNHMHLFPIISFPYPPENVTPAWTFPVGTPPELQDWRVAFRETIRDALYDATQAEPSRPGTVLLASSANRFDLADSLGRFTLGGTDFAPVTDVGTVIYYDGADIVRGNRTYHYGGVPPDTMFLVDTTQYLIELVKHDLRIEAGPGDLSRLIAQQLVGVSRRGVYVVPQMCVQKIELPVGYGRMARRNGRAGRGGTPSLLGETNEPPQLGASSAGSKVGAGGATGATGATGAEGATGA